MLCIDNHGLDPYKNIALEEALLSLYPGETVVMLWHNPPCVVCGKNQNIFEEVCLPEVWDAGISVVRRNTGGGTVYHDMGNLNYTVITPKENAADGYPHFLLPMADALCGLGVPCAPGGICDLVADGKKLSGSAQAVIGTSVLHHGTLLFDADLTVLHRLTTNRESSAIHSKAIRSKPAPVGNIRQYVAPEMTLAGFRAYLWMALSDGTVPREPNEAESALAERLAEEKYRTWDWIYGKSPAFSFAHTVSGKKIAYTARRGRIADFSVDGVPLPALMDVPLRPDALSKALTDAGYDALSPMLLLGGQKG